MNADISVLAAVKDKNKVNYEDKGTGNSEK